MALLVQLGRVMVRQGRAADSVAVTLICDQFSGQIEDVKAGTPVTASVRNVRSPPGWTLPDARCETYPTYVSEPRNACDRAR